MSKSRGREEKLRQKRQKEERRKNLETWKTPTNLWGFFLANFNYKTGENWDFFSPSAFRPKCAHQLGSPPYSQRPHLVGTILLFKMSKSRGREEKLRQKRQKEERRKNLETWKTPTNLWGFFLADFNYKTGEKLRFLTKMCPPVGVSPFFIYVISHSTFWIALDLISTYFRPSRSVGALRVTLKVVGKSFPFCSCVLSKDRSATEETLVIHDHYPYWADQGEAGHAGKLLTVDEVWDVGASHV